MPQTWGTRSWGCLTVGVGGATLLIEIGSDFCPARGTKDPQSLLGVCFLLHAPIAHFCHLFRVLSQCFEQLASAIRMDAPRPRDAHAATSGAGFAIHSSIARLAPSAMLMPCSAARTRKSLLSSSGSRIIRVSSMGVPPFLAGNYSLHYHYYHCNRWQQGPLPLYNLEEVAVGAYKGAWAC